MGHGDQPPVAVSGGNFHSEDRATSSSARPDAGAVEAPTPAIAATATQQESDSFHGTFFQILEHLLRHP
jgi:hypothetical protein